ncbi:orotate phosphoribosyltransferase [Camelliibacillus cellulosilyticus]|uniref:Orotate phosphoribosyltransferase n=1 Tax=Camelliibacillus cellulosilyticus TaxID=2174486 RepID=A0ABV9GKT5_9BACL
MTNLKEAIAEQLLKIGAVVLSPNDPFTWSSGLKAPIYCDNRLTLSFPEVRSMIADGFVSLINEKDSAVDVIAGAATGGIAHAAWVSEKMNVPMVYVRGKAKGHGKKSQVEGLVHPGQKVIVIEDLVSTGGSALTVVDALKAEGCDVLGVAAIFTYGLKAADENFAQAEIPVETLTDFHTLLDVATRSGKISEQERRVLEAWHAKQ